MKKQNKKNNFNKLIIIIPIILLTLTILAIVIYKMVVPVYSVSDRTQKLRQKQGEDDTVIGWLRLQGTNVDYPVVYSSNEKFYNDEYDYDYLWTNSDSLKLNSRVIVWGHNVKNVSNQPMLPQKNFTAFESLPAFLNYDFAKENEYIQYTIDGKNYLYKIYSVTMLNKETFQYNEYMAEDEKKEYINNSIKESYYKYDVEVSSKKNLITLATCTRFFDKTTTIIKVEGVMVDNNEKVKKYKVTKNKKYNIVENKMKGDD